MTAEPQPVRDKDLDLAVRALSAVEEPGGLAALAYEVLSSQAEGRTLLAGATRAKRQAEEHGVDHEGAETAAGNLLTILERGAKTPVERALVTVFAAKGLDLALADDAEESRALVFRFVRHADWLEVSGDYSVYGALDAVLAEESAALVWAELAQRVVDEAAGRDGGRPEVRARNAARMSALTLSSSEAAKDGLREIVRSSALDEPTRLLASTLAGDGLDEGPTVQPRVSGRLGRAPGRGGIEILRWISGWAVAAWVVRGLGFLCGLRTSADLRLSEGSVEVHTQLSLFGRVLQEGRDTWRVDALEGAGRRVRYPSLHLLAGATALSAGVLFGSLVLFDGVRSGELILILLAAVLVLAGAGLDLALDVFVPARKGHVVMDLATRGKGPLRVTSVPLDEADAFLRALRNATSRSR